MATFVDFAEEVVAKQVSYYESVEGEYNEDPFSVQYQSEIDVDRLFGLPAGSSPPESYTSLLASRKLEKLATTFYDSLATEEQQQRLLFQKHRDALAKKENELVELCNARDTDDPLYSMLSGEPTVKKALIEYRRYGIDALCFVVQANVLAIIDPVTKQWFFPRRLPEHLSKLDTSLFRLGDTMGRIDQDQTRNHTVCVLMDMEIRNDFQPVWFTQLTEFHLPEILESSPWSYPEKQEWVRSFRDPGQELIRAMVVTSQVKSFFGKRDNISEVDSYRRVDDLYTIFHQHVKTQFVIPALETVRQWFLARDWSNFYSLALQQLPVVRPCERNEDRNEDDGLECIMTGRRTDLVRVTLVRCIVLDWDRTVPFADYVAKFKTLYSAGQRRWWHVVTHPLASLRHNRSRRRSRSRLSSCSSVDSIRSSDILTFGSNSRHRGRRYGISPSWENSNDDDDDDNFEGFLIGPWTNSLLLHRSVAYLLWQAWRLTHLEHWTSAVLIQWKRDKSVLDATDKDIIALVSDTITTAIQQCRHPNGS